MKKELQNTRTNKSVKIRTTASVAFMLCAVALFALISLAYGGGYKSEMSSFANSGGGQTMISSSAQSAYGGGGQTRVSSSVQPMNCGRNIADMNYNLTQTERSAELVLTAMLTDEGLIFLNWNNVSADQYVIKLGGKSILTLTGRKLSANVTTSLIDGGVYNFAVEARSVQDDAESTFATADLRYEHFITLKLADKPRVVNNLLTWGGVRGATSYSVIINGVGIGKTIEPQFNFLPFLGENGVFTIRILCENNSANAAYYTCELSDAIIYTLANMPPTPQNVSANSMFDAHYIMWKHSLILTFCAVARYDESGVYPDLEYVEGGESNIDITEYIDGDGEYVAFVKAMDGEVSSETVTCRFVVANGMIVRYNIV